MESIRDFATLKKFGTFEKIRRNISVKNTIADQR